MEQHKDDIIKLYKEYTCTDIGKIYNKSGATIFRWLQKWGVNTSEHILGNNNFIKQHKDDIIKLYNESNSCTDIAKLYKSKGYIISRWLRRWGVDTSKNKYLFNKKISIKQNRSRITKQMFESGLYTNFMEKGAEYGKSIKSREKTSERSKKMWQDQSMRAKLTDIARKNWYTNKMWEKMKCFKNTKPEIIVEKALNYLGIKYKKHYQVDKYNIDFFIESANLLLDIDGEYWHGRLPCDHNQVKYVLNKDKEKTLYLNNLPKYKYVRWWETSTFDRVNLIVRLCKLFNISLEKENFNLSDITIKSIDIDRGAEFVELFHYYGNIGHSIIQHGAFVGDKMIGVAAYSKPNYDNEANENLIELSRFCIDPKYQIKNCASKILSASLKLLKQDVITFADTTQGHDGAIYRACNFLKIGESPGSYYYTDDYGNKFHKKTIYNQARSLKYTEADYVKITMLKKIKEKKKIKYLYITR